MAQILFNWLTPLRWIFLAIDSLLFGLIDGCYTIIISFANAELFTTEQIAELRTKIYFVITLIAFFRLAFLLVNSLINPDKLTDENEGLSKIAFNFVIMLVLLVVTPIIFNIALEFQKEVVNGNVITGIFSLSNSSGYSCNDTYTDKQLEIDRNDYKTEEDYLNEKEHKKAAKCSSDKMKGLVINSLIYPDSKIAHEEDGKYAINDDVTCTGSCKDAIEAYNTMTEDGYYDFLTLEKYIAATGEVNDSEVFAYNYTLIITTICSGFIVYILLSFAFDLGKRLLELNLLMILSPLFIATYVDPKSAKSGPFNNWLKAIGKSYVSLFLKLAALAVMLLFIKILSINKVGLKPIGPIGFIILLFAGLTFCKELPKWLGGLLGSEGGMGELGLGKKLGATPLLGGAAKKAGYLAAGHAMGSLSTLNARRKAGKEALKAARRDNKVGGWEGAKNLATGIRDNGFAGFKDFAGKRMDARKTAIKNNGGMKKTLAQYAAAGILGGKAGATASLKSDNLKGTLKTSVQAGRQTAAGLGIASETLGQKIKSGIGVGTSFLESQYGSYKERDDRVKKLEDDKLVKSIAGKGITESGYGHGQLAVSNKHRKAIMENSEAFGEGKPIGTFEDFLAAQYAITVGSVDEKTGKLTTPYITKPEPGVYSIAHSDGHVETVNEKALIDNLNGLIDDKTPGMFHMQKNWYDIQSQMLGNYQYNQNAVNNAMTASLDSQKLVEMFTGSVKSSLGPALTSALNSADIKVNIGESQVKLDSTNFGDLKFNKENIRAISSGISSQISSLGDVSETSRTPEQNQQLDTLQELLTQVEQLASATSRSESARAELAAAEKALKKVEAVYVSADGDTSEEKIHYAQINLEKAKGKIPKEEDK